MRHLPYAIGLFMLSPIFVWVGLWLAYPGPKPGITDAPLIAALIGISIPLVLYHYIAGLAFIANSMAGAAGEVRPLWAPARWLQRAMIPLTGLATLGASAWLVQSGEALPFIALLAACGLVMMFGLVKAEGGRGWFNVHETLASLVRGSARLLMATILRLPLIGPMLREIERDPNRAAPFIVANMVLGTILFVWLFGFTALVIPALMAVPVAFYLMITLAAD